MERDDKSLEEKKYIETATMAEIYIQAKKYEEGLEIYKRILAKDPANSEIAKKVEELEKKLSKIE
jgi:tetratricopeptide (TPR) repeat protein